MRFFEGSIKIKESLSVQQLNTHFLHILVQKWLLCDISILSYKILNIAMYDIFQNNFT